MPTSKYGGIPVEDQPQSKYGGVAVDDQPPQSKYGGIAVSDSTPSPPNPNAPSQAELDDYLKQRYNGPNDARNRRQRNMDSGMTPLQIWNRDKAVKGVIADVPGSTDIQKGSQQIVTPGERKAGIHNLVTGTGKMVGTVAIPAGLVMAPGPTLYALGVGSAASAGANTISRIAGADPDTADLVGDAAGIVAGGTAGEPGRVGEATRAFIRQSGKEIPGYGKIGRIADAVKNAWNGATADSAAGGAQPSTATPKRAPVATSATGNGAATVIPPSRQLAAPARVFNMPAAADTSGVIHGWKPTILENENAPAAAAIGEVQQPKPAPPSKNELDDIAKSLGGKDYASATPAQKKAIEGLARNAPAATPAAIKPKPAPAPANPVTKPEVPEAPAPAPEVPKTRPMTPMERVDAELAQRRADATAGAPKPAPSNSPIPAPTAAGSPEAATRAEMVKRAAADLHGKGINAEQLLTLTPEQRAAALGDDAEAFPDIVSELRSHAARGKMETARAAKDSAMARFFQAKGITPDQVAAMDEGTLATHIKSAGYRIPGKSGALGRSHAEVQHDIVEAMNDPDNPAPKRAPGSSESAAATPPVTPVPPQASSAPNNPVTATVRTPNQTKAQVQYRISEADDLKTSFDPDYNTDIGHQPRDTSRLGSRQRVEQRKLDMDPEAMGPSRMAGDGAPITKEGNAVTRNHGTQALKELYAEGSPKAQQYKDYVAENANLAGMSPEDVAGMKKPILHRELVSDWDHPQIKKFADEANMSSTARMSEAELASQMGSKMSGAKMDAFKPTDDGVPNPEFVRGMIGDLPAEEQAQFFDRKGEVSQTGARLIRNAVFAKAYRSPEAIERMAESTDSQVRNISSGMLKAAPEFAKLQEAIDRGDAHNINIADEVGKAMEVLDHLRTQKKSVKDWLSQTDLMGKSPVVQVLVDTLAKESRRPNMIRDTLQNFTSLVKGLGNPKQAGMFGHTELPSKLEVLEKAYGKAKADAAAKEKGSGEKSLLDDLPVEEVK